MKSREYGSLCIFTATLKICTVWLIVLIRAWILLLPINGLSAMIYIQLTNDEIFAVAQLYCVHIYTLGVMQLLQQKTLCGYC